MNLWLDDVREPHQYGRLGWTWAKTGDEVLALLAGNLVQVAALDHDLAPEHYPGLEYLKAENPTLSGTEVAKAIVRDSLWPQQELIVHSLNPLGAKRMMKIFLRNAPLGLTITRKPATLER